MVSMNLGYYQLGDCMERSFSRKVNDALAVFWFPCCCSDVFISCLFILFLFFLDC